MFRLTGKEAEMLVSQNVIPSKKSLGGYLPSVFTQEGVAMLSSVLRSERYKSTLPSLFVCRTVEKLKAAARFQTS
jgi:hypothetical protein